MNTTLGAGEALDSEVMQDHGWPFDGTDSDYVSQ